MNINIGLPNITSTTPQGQIGEMRSYIYQLAEQLNWAFNTINDAQTSGNNSNIVIAQENGGKQSLSADEAQTTFNSIKGLIIKSADIVRAYEETIKKDFNGEYFADSDFGTYLEQTSRTIEENSKGVTEVYSNIQTLTTDDGKGRLDLLESDVKTTNAYIKRGFLGNDKISGEAAYGIAIGETDDNGAYKHYAWFTADRLTFFDEGGEPVAYIGAGCLYVVGKVQFLGEAQFGGYKIDTSDGLAFTWIS